MKLSKTYNPTEYETTIYKRWEDSDAFKPVSRGEKDPFTIIMPPPNANGSLHIGHAMYTVEDIMIRYRRMLGHPTLWLPGTDHAGIETQVQFEKVLEKEGKTRFDLGPDKFYERVLKFTRDNQDQIINQLRSLGFSADWSKQKFTLDADIVDEVYDTFESMLKDDLVYRGNRVVNHCPRCNTAFSDIEVKYVQNKDKMYTLDYGNVKIATTRPETIFADTAVAINPKDKERKHLVGKTATVPLLNKEVPIITHENVDPKEGTGALKVTPGHDFNDFEIGLDHDLEMISVIDENGRMVGDTIPARLKDMSAQDARDVTVQMLKDEGLLIKEEDIHHMVGHCYRCGTRLEPLLSDQWYVRVEELSKKAIKVLENGDLEIIPKKFNKQYTNWLENLRDWNISRQIWWGIPIPIAYRVGEDDKKKPYIFARTEEEAENYYGKGNFEMEIDTFDTWFSSGQWPFITLKTLDLYKDYYPTSVMETGRDILFQWVTRMVMLGLYRTKEVPFKKVYLHGMVRDGKGQKMSKSKGNVIDPLEVTDEYGTDALRMALVIGITPGNDGSVSEDKIKGYRNFCNKLWNISRFILDKAGEDFTPQEIDLATPADAWMMQRLQQSITEVTDRIERYRFSEAGELIYSLAWDDFADWYLEASKEELNVQLLMYSLEVILKLLHPFAPFVTEAIWQYLPDREDDLIISPWPETLEADLGEGPDEFRVIKDVVSEVRNIKAELQLSDPILYYTDSQLLDNHSELIQSLAGLQDIKKVTSGRGLHLTGTDIDAWLDVEENVSRMYLMRLISERQDEKKRVSSAESKLSNKGFLSNAPKEVIEETKEYKEEASTRIDKLNKQIEIIERSLTMPRTVEEPETK